MSEPAEPIFDPESMVGVLLGHGVEFTIIGGVAVQTHGHVRATIDLDIVPAPDLLNLSRLSEALAAMGASLRRASQPIDPGDPDLLKRAAFVPLQTEYGPLDLLNVGKAEGLPKTYSELRQRAVEIDYDGRTVAVAGLDDLIRMKRVAGREVDLSDIGALTRTDEELEAEAPEST